MSPVELAAVIRKMEAAGESPENIKLVVRHHAGAKPAAPAEKPSAASSFGSGVLESAGLPGTVAEAQAMGAQSLSNPIDTIMAALKGATPQGMTQNMLDAVTAEATPALEGTGPAPGIDKVLRAILGQTPLGPAAESVSHVGTALGSGDPNDMARAGGNVTGLVLQALLAKGGPKAGKAAGSTLKAVPRSLPDVGPLASALENPALLALAEGAGGRMASRGVTAGVGGILGGIPGAVAGSELGPLLAKRGVQAPASILRLLEKASGKDPYLSPGRLGLEEVSAALDAPASAPAKAPAAAVAAPGEAGATKAGQPPQIQFKDLPESVQRLLNDATKKPAERAIAREAINDARKGDPTRLEHLARQLDAQQPNPVATATDQLAGLTPDSVAPQPQVPGPAASLEELLRQSIRQRGGVPADQAAPAIPPELAKLLLPDGQRAMPGGRSGTGVSPTSPKLAAPAVTATSDLEALLRSSLKPEPGVRAASAPETYWRNTSGDIEAGGGGMLMFAKNGESVRGYGKNRWSLSPDEVSPKAVVSATDPKFRSAAKKAIRDAIKSRRLQDYDGASVESLVDDLNPKKIVDSAGSWDASDIAEVIYTEVLEPKGWKVVLTDDGAMAFDKSLARSR